MPTVRTGDVGTYYEGRDVRGHGRAGGSARKSYSVELFADDSARSSLDNPEFFTVAVRELLVREVFGDAADGHDAPDDWFKRARPFRNVPVAGRERRGIRGLIPRNRRRRLERF